MKTTPSILFHSSLAPMAPAALRDSRKATLSSAADSMVPSPSRSSFKRPSAQSLISDSVMYEFWPLVWSETVIPSYWSTQSPISELLEEAISSHSTSNPVVAESLLSSCVTLAAYSVPALRSPAVSATNLNSTVS